MDFEKGIPIAVIRDPKDRKADGSLLYLNEKMMETPERRSVTMEYGVKVEPLPIISTEKQNSRVFVSGPSGSGKSTWVKLYLDSYRKIFPDKKLFYISRLKEDPAFASIPFNKIDANDRDTVLALAVNDFKNSFVLMDDFECLDANNKDLLNHLLMIRDTILETGRHMGTDICVVTHTLLNSHRSKLLHLESNQITLFVKSNFTPIANWLKRYVGVGKEDIERVRLVPSRWITVRRQYPTCVLHERGAFLL